MDVKQSETTAVGQGTRTGKPPERLASVHKGLEPLHRSTNSFRTIEPQSSRGAAYLRNTVAIIKGEEKRDYSKVEQFKMKRRCASIKAPSDHDIKTLEVRLFYDRYYVNTPLQYNCHLIFTALKLTIFR